MKKLPVRIEQGVFYFLGFIGLLGNFYIEVFFVNSAYAVLYFYAYFIFGSIGRFYSYGIVGFEILLCHPFRIGCFSVIESVCIGFQTARYLSFYGNGLSEFGSCGNGDIEGNRHSYFDCKVFLYNCAYFILCLYAYVIIGCFCGLDDCGIFGTEKIPFTEVLLTFVCSIPILFVMEVFKKIKFRRS